MSLYDRVMLTETKLAHASLRILDFLAGHEHAAEGYPLVEYPKGVPNRAGFGPQLRDYAPICTLRGCGSRQVLSLMKKGLIEPTPAGHRITKKGRKALEATGWTPPAKPYTMVPRHLDRP